jgi:serine/threonine protein kinase
MLEAEQILNHQYQLIQLLRENASRQTWLATDLANRPPNRVVMKFLVMNPQMQWDEAKLLEREAQILQKLHHPRIPSYCDYFVLDQLSDSRFPWFCLVQSHVPGHSLQQLLDQGRHFSEGEVEKIAIDVLSILVYLHKFDPPILHRDIKPSNLIWGEDDRLYLIDFGSVQDRAAVEGATFTVVGTYGYVPMEQFGGRAVPASDLYALGATLIHLLTGTAPADLPHQNTRIQFAQQVSIDPALVNWVSKLTEPDLTARLDTAREALDALQNRHQLSLPTVNRKPKGSQIQLKKTVNQLEIKIPPRGWQAISWLYCLSFIGGSWYMLVQIAGSPMLGGLYALLCLSFLISIALPALRQTVIRGDRTHVIFCWELLGFTLRK